MEFYLFFFSYINMTNLVTPIEEKKLKEKKEKTKKEKKKETKEEKKEETKEEKK